MYKLFHPDKKLNLLFLKKVIVKKNILRKNISPSILHVVMSQIAKLTDRLAWQVHLYKRYKLVILVESP